MWFQQDGTTCHWTYEIEPNTYVCLSPTATYTKWDCASSFSKAVSIDGEAKSQLDH